MVWNPQQPTKVDLHQSGDYNRGLKCQLNVMNAERNLTPFTSPVNTKNYVEIVMIRSDHHISLTLTIYHTEKGYTDTNKGDIKWG